MQSQNNSPILMAAENWQISFLNNNLIFLYCGYETSLGRFSMPIL